MSAIDLPALLHDYGYALIFLGTIIEAESLLLLGGYFAHRGYLELPFVMAAAFAGAVCGDQLFFSVGRHHAKRLLARFPKMRAKVDVALHRIEQHQIKVMLSMRFLPGLRIALPIALGLSTVSRARFFWFNLVSAAVWSCMFAVVGFGAGRLLSPLFADLRRNEHWIVGAFVALALATLVWQLGRPRRQTP